MKFRSSYIWAVLVALGVAGWMASGQFSGAPSGGGQQADASTPEAAADGAPAPGDAVPDSPIISAVEVVNSAVRRTVRATSSRHATHAAHALKPRDTERPRR